MVLEFFFYPKINTHTYIYTHQIPAKSYILEIKLFTRIPLSNGVFWLNIAKFEINWCYRYCFNLFSNLRKESELRQYHCRNSTKVGERKIKSSREKFFIFGNGIAAIPFAHTCCRVGAWSVSARKENQMMWKKTIRQLWQCHCRKWEEKKIVIVEITCEELKKKELRLQYFYNIFTTNHR